MKVQVWAPQQPATALLQGLLQAHLQVSQLGALAEVDGDAPLLLVYREPLQLALQPQPSAAVEAYRQLLEALPQLQVGLRVRLVNLDALALPALVAWAVESATPLPETERWPSAALPTLDPLAAVLACQWLEASPEVLQAYQQLESHPLAAAFDQRPPDLACLERYRQACNRPALLQLMQQQQELQADLQELAAELAPRRAEQLQALELREQMQEVHARLQAAEQAERRCEELEISLQAQQADLEQLARRLALLEALVAEGSSASERLQLRLAQLLA